MSKTPPTSPGARPPVQRRQRTRRDRVQQEPPRPETLSPRLLIRRQNILHAATHLLFERSYDEVQMRDVADAAGVALGTVYRYFGSKEHLFAAVFLAWQSSMLHAVADADPTLAFNNGSSVGATNSERLTALAHTAVEAFERHPYFYDLLVMMARTDDPYARDISRQAARDSERIFAEPLVGIAPEERQIIVSIIGAMLETYLGSWLAGVTTIEGVHETMQKVVGMLRLPD